jgi:hypothetical protein
MGEKAGKWLGLRVTIYRLLLAQAANIAYEEMSKIQPAVTQLEDLLADA